MSRQTIAIVYITFPTQDDAIKIGRRLVEERLAACVNLHAAGISIYEWANDIHQENEYVLIAKTTRAKVPALTERVVALHPYETPCVLAWEASMGHPPFMHWVQETVEKSHEG